MSIVYDLVSVKISTIKYVSMLPQDVYKLFRLPVNAEKEVRKRPLRCMRASGGVGPCSVKAVYELYLVRSFQQ